MALQAQALAAVGGQFSHLGFSNNAVSPLSLTASQYPVAAAATNLTGLIPTMNVMNSGVPPLLGQATIGGGGSGGGSQKSPSGAGYKSLMSNPHRGSGLNSLSASSSSAKRTRLETGSSGGGGGGVGSGNSSGLPAGAAAARSANLVSLVTPKQDPFPPTTRVAPRTSTTASSSAASLCVTSRLQSSATSRPNTASNSHNSNNNSTQKYTHGIAAKFSDMRVGGQEADRRQNSNGSAPTTGAESQRQQQGQRSHPYSEDILICGQCRQLFESVDVLIAHKMAGCSINKENGLTCRCKRSGEPDCLDCAYCGDNFSSAWELVSHCHTEHGLTIYAIPSQPSSPSSQPSATSETARPTSPKRQHVSKDIQGRSRGCSSTSSSSVLSRSAAASGSSPPPAKTAEQSEEEEEEEYDFEVNTPQADVCEEEEVTAAGSEASDEPTRSRGGSVDEQQAESNQAAAESAAEAPVVDQDSEEEEEEADNEESEEAQEEQHEAEQQRQEEPAAAAESSKPDALVVEEDGSAAKDGAAEPLNVKCAKLDDAATGKARTPERAQRTSFRRERRGSEHGRNETCTDDEEGEEYAGDRSA